MMPKFYTLLLSVCCWFWYATAASGQCTTAAGTLTNVTPLTLCENASFTVSAAGNAVLDGDDILLFVAYTGATPNASNVLASSSTGDFPCQASFLANVDFKVAIVAGNNAGGTIDWTDPCLSVSPARLVHYNANPSLNVADAVLNCLQTNVTLAANSNQTVVYVWSNTAQGANVVIPQPGTYCVTATNTVTTCSATKCATVSQDIIPPNANAGPDFTLTCASPVITLTPNASVGPQFVYLWTGPSNFSSQVLYPVVTQPGIYTLMVVNTQNGCTATDNVVVTQDVQLPLSISVNLSPGCSGAHNGFIQANVVGGGGLPLTYLWTGPSGFAATTPNITNLAPGTYTLVVASANGCSQTFTYVLANSSPLSVDVQYAQKVCGGNLVRATASGGVAPYQYSWNSGSIYAVQTNLTDGIYILTVTDAVGCTVVDSILIQGSGNSSGICGFLSGSVYRDTLENCQNDQEPGLSNWLVAAIGVDTFYGNTDTLGQFLISAPPGTYVLKTYPPNALWAPCTNVVQGTINQANDIVAVGNLMVKAFMGCPALKVDIGVAQLRRCFSGNYYVVQYCNTGTAQADSAYVLVTLDPFLTPISASLPYTDLGNQVLRFDIGNLASQDCGVFYFNVKVSCDAVLGQTHCTTAHIYPDSICTPPNAQWSGALLKLNAKCNSDSLQFILKNIGDNDLTESVKYIVIEDHVMVMDAYVGFLASGDSVIVSVPANGSSWYFQSQQAQFAPFLSQPILAVEGCTTQSTFTTGIVNQYSDGDQDPWLDIDCTPNTGSYDPNDKEGIPLGYGVKNYIRPGTTIDYRIRFQNTGTDTAFNIVVVDTLSGLFDVQSFQAGASSHPYRYEIYGNGIVRFIFENIMLPDSNVNEATSHGFVKFTIHPGSDVPLGTSIPNSAAIYFDFNEPVITNTSIHTIQEDFVQTGVWSIDSKVQLELSPNPFSQETLVKMEGLKSFQPVQLSVYDLKGSLVHRAQVSAASFVLKRNGLRAGVYLLRLAQDGVELGSGKMIIQD
jgi:uncharacterized repeat protein (TIGR01451 family)